MTIQDLLNERAVVCIDGVEVAAGLLKVVRVVGDKNADVKEVQIELDPRREPAEQE